MNQWKRISAIVLSGVLVLSAVLGNGSDSGLQAKAKKKKATLKTKSVNLKVGKTTKILIDNKKDSCKYTFRSGKKKVATVSGAGKIKAVRVGKTNIIVKEVAKKGKGKAKKLGTVKVNVTAKSEKKTTSPPTAPVQTPTPAADTPAATTSAAPSNSPTPEPTPVPELPAPTPIKPNDTDASAFAKFTHPLLYADVPDLDIIRVEDNYYMVSTTMNLCPGVPVMKSKDLVHWQIVNYVYDTFIDADDANLENGRDMYTNGSWAASLKYDEVTKKYYVAFNTNGHGFYIYTTSDIENGPWTQYTGDGGYHDPSLLFDDGKMYVVSAGGSSGDQCQLQQLKLDEDKKTVKKTGASVRLFKKNANKWQLWEGAHAYKVGDYYYVCMIASPTSGWFRTEVCYRSSSIAKGSKWEEKVIYQGAMGDGNAGLAQGGFVQTQYGDWYGFLFQDHGGAGRIPSLVDVQWKSGWPMMGTYDAGGVFKENTATGESVVKLKDSGEQNYIVDSDEFDYKEGDKLKLVWQWNHNPKNDCWSVTANPGHLRLTTDRVCDNIRNAHNSLTQRTVGTQMTSETKINVDHMKAGDFAGLASVADHASMIGVQAGENGEKQIVRANYTFPNSGTDDKTPVEVAAKADKKITAGQEISLKIEYKFDGTSSKANYFYSLDGMSWEELGGEFSMGFSTNTTFMGTRTWLFNYATKEAGGYVDFDYYKVR